MRDTSITAAISITPNAINAPKPRALPVVAFPIKLVLLRTALPPVIIAAMDTGKAVRITYGTNKPNTNKTHAATPSNREVDGT